MENGVLPGMSKAVDPHRSAPWRRQAGFTLIELLMVIVIIAILAAIAIPVFLGSREKAKSADCLVQREYAERAARAHDLSSNTAHDFQVLVSEQLIDKSPVCPSGGTYSWGSVGGQPVLYCSVHAPGGTLAALTPLGSTFVEISGGLIRLIDAFYAANGRYPRSWGDYRWTDLGLTTASWQSAVDHVFYQPSGNRVQIRPETGFVIQVTNTQGTKLTLTNRSNWNLVYDNATGQWYYHTIEPSNRIDITTILVKPS